MKALKRVALAAGIAAALIMIPTQVANAYVAASGPFAGPWRDAYVQDPAYRWGSPAMKPFVSDPDLRGYANRRQQRRLGYW